MKKLNVIHIINLEEVCVKHMDVGRESNRGE